MIVDMATFLSLEIILLRRFRATTPVSGDLTKLATYTPKTL